MDILLATTSHAAVITALDNDRRTVAALPVILEGPDSPVRDQAVAFREAASSFATEAAHVAMTYTPTARVGQLRVLVTRTLTKPVQRLVEAGQAEARAIGAAWARLLFVPDTDASTAVLRQSDRLTFSALTVGDKAAWMMSASFGQLAAIMEAGKSRFPDMTSEIWNRIEHRYAALNYIRMAGTAADYARQPTAAEPLAIGVDMDAAERAANDALERHKSRNDIVDAVELAVQGIVNVVGLTCDLTVDDAFALLTDAKVPA